MDTRLEEHRVSKKLSNDIGIFGLAQLAWSCIFCIYEAGMVGLETGPPEGQVITTGGL